MKKRRILTIIIGLIILPLIGISQTYNFGFHAGYSTFGLNVKDVFKEYRGEINLIGNRFDLGIDYTFSLIERKKNDNSLLTGTTGLYFNGLSQQGLSYSKIDIPLKIDFVIPGNKLLDNGKNQWNYYAGFGFNLSKVVSKGSFEEFSAFEETQRAFQILFTSEIGLGYALNNGHELCLFGVYREGLVPLYSNTFESIRVKEPIRSNSILELSAGFFISYKMPVK